MGSVGWAAPSDFEELWFCTNWFLRKANFATLILIQKSFSSFYLSKSKNLHSHFWNPNVDPDLDFKTNFFYSFTATGNVLCTIDSLGQLYLYRLSPISDPCGPHVAASLQTMFEFCLVSSLDWWDLTVCLKPTDVEAVCNRLEENFSKQNEKVKDYYHSRYMSLKR